MNQICPQCGSSNITYDKNLAYVATGLINQFKQCLDCGHHGSFFPESDKLVKLKKKTETVLVETSFGKGYWKYFIYVAIPILILAIILTIL